MDKEELIQFEGSVLDVLPDGRFRVGSTTGMRFWLIPRGA